MFASGLVVGVALFGCGGKGGASSPKGASLEYKVEWPNRARATPIAANSAVVTLVKDGVVIDQATLNRPQDSNAEATSLHTFENLPTGDLSVSATAYPELDGSGNAVATGGSTVTMAKGEKAEETAVLATTATTVELTATTTVVSAGDTGEITATVRDQKGDIVLTKSGDSIDPVAWECDSPNVKLTATSTGAHFEATGSGDANVKVTFEGLTATLKIHVQ